MEISSTNIYRAFQESCQKYAAKTCLKFKKGDAYQSLTYAELCGEVGQIRQILLGAGIKPGQRVAILLSNGPLWPASFFAVVSLQAVAVPVDAQLGGEEIKDMLSHSVSKLLLTEEKFAVSLGEVLPVASAIRVVFLDRRDRDTVGGRRAVVDQQGFPPHKLAALFYTSGTTQKHKAVMLTHANLLSNIEAIRELGLVTEDDVVISVLPLHHTYPFMVTCLLPLLQGATVCYLASLVAHELFSSIRENEVTIFVGVPQLFSLMEHSIAERLKKYSFFLRWAVLKKVRQAFGGRIRFMASGGAKLDPRVARNFYRWGFKIIEGYGLTETSPVVTFNPLDSARFESVGKPLPGVEVRIVRPNEEGAGEIAVRGGNVMLGYYREPALTRSVMQDGWFLTGDVGSLDRDGYLHISGRLNELIVLPSGKKINPEVIEAHYLKSPFIKEICVMYARAGGGTGHLAAVIVADEEFLKLKKHVNIHFKIRWELDSYSQKMPPYQRVKGFVLAKEALPRTRLGKLVRHKIEQKFASGVFEQEEKKIVEELPRSRFEEAALKYLSRILKKDVRIDDHLELDLGVDSLGRIELLSALQELMSAGIDDSLALELFQARTVRDLITKAHEALPENAFGRAFRREDLIFWSHVLRESPAQASLSRLKLHFGLFDKFISLLEISIFKFSFRAVFSLRVQGRSHIPADGPFIVTPNHVSYLDAFYLLCALPYRLLLKTYFVGFADIFNHPFLAWAVRFHRLIPLDPNLSLAETLKVCRYVLEQGKILVYFSEGQRSADGKVKEFRKGIGILVKESQARVLPVFLAGAYKAWPRRRAFPLPADVTVKIGRCLEPREISQAGKEEDPYIRIADRLKEEVERLKNS